MLYRSNFGELFDASDVITPVLECLPSHWPAL